MRTKIGAVIICLAIAPFLLGFNSVYASNQSHFQAPKLSASVKKKQKENKASVGWVRIKDTDINKVVLQNPNVSGGNSYYLTHDFYGKPDKNGEICSDRRWDLKKGLPRNTILYGHSWSDDPNGFGFHQLKRYLDIDFAKKHPYIYFSTSKTDMVWEVFAVFYTTVKLPYVLPDMPWEQFKEVIKVAKKSSLYDYGIIVTESDKVLTLSTCTYSVPGNENLPLRENDYRFVVMARLVKPETPLAKKAGLRKNTDILKPDEQPGMKAH